MPPPTTTLPATAVIRPGTTTAVVLFKLTPLDDGDPEGAETVTVTARRPDGTTAATATIELTDPGYGQCTGGGKNIQCLPDLLGDYAA